jgi:predicted ATPase
MRDMLCRLCEASSASASAYRHHAAYPGATGATPTAAAVPRAAVHRRPASFGVGDRRGGLGVGEDVGGPIAQRARAARIAVRGTFAAVRVAFSGSHRVGKTTLVERVAERLPGYATVDEPYYLLEEDGYEAAEVPTIEDFEAQLVRSLAALDEGGRNVLFDRCPVDVLAYLLEHDDAAAFESEEWLDRIRDAVETLDLIVFVPIEEVDRIALAPHEDAGLRRAVHDRLRDLLIDHAVAVEILTVAGSVRARVEQVLARLAC